MKKQVDASSYTIPRDTTATMANGLVLIYKRLESGSFISYGLCQRFWPQEKFPLRQVAILIWHDPHR